VLGERRVPTSLEDLQQRLLDQSIDDTRNAEFSDPAIRLGDFNPFDRLRCIGSIQQFFPDGGPVLTQVVRGFVDGKTVDAWATLVPTDAFPRYFEVSSITHLLHKLFFCCRAFGGSLRRKRIGPLAVGAQRFTPAFRRKGQTQLRVLGFLPLSTQESRVLLATPNRSGLRPSFPARPICCSAFRHWSASLALPTAWPTMPSADFCTAVRAPHGSLSPELTGHDADLPR